ncbi:TIGR02266 family protein [Hyalangium sp.]|uniref:TIGR02266 family protein n=1 Tax=Hyalangium sp. TaxID=2028555 RepID=UPI002D74DEAB|nr:TIGR02266 family protein [Hyalangium sp.]HYH94557.1 TIGR02266 family protein [Hyalangium sp.]
MEQGRRATDRKAVGLLVKLKHSDVGSFAEEFATNLSPGGMFIRSRTPQALGTLVKFEVQIAGGVRVLRGTAVVRWVRETANEEGPPGMGLQFQELDPLTQALIDRMLQLNKEAAEAQSASAASEPEPSVDAAALEREMLAKGMLDRVGKRVTASRLPAIAPSVAPVPLTPKGQPEGSSSKSAAEEFSASLILAEERMEESADLGALLDDLADLGSPLGSPGASPASAPPFAPTPVPLAVPPPGTGDVDIAVDDLILAAPTPTPVPEVKFEVLDEPMPDIDFEMESLGGDLPVAVGMPLEEIEAPPVVSGMPLPPVAQAAPTRPVAPPPPPAAAQAVPSRPAGVFPAIPAAGAQAQPVAPPPAAPQPQARPPAPPPAAAAAPAAPAPASPDLSFDVDLGLGSSKLVNQSDSPDFKPGKGVEFDLDLGSGEDIDVDKPGQPSRRKAKPPRSAPPLPSVPSPAQPMAAPPRAFPAPAPGASAPEARAEAPRAPAPPPASAPPPPAPRPEPPSKTALPPTVFLQPQVPAQATGPVIGIDLGTTNSCVAIMSGGRPMVLRSKEGYNTIPSVISISSQGKLLVSHRAKSQLVMRPTQTIYGAKRIVGRPYESAVVKQVRERFHYEIVPDALGRAAVRIADRVLSLEEVQGLILKECKEMAEQHLGQKVERAVVTVPAYYSEPQREAVRKSGALAGLKVERILNEPTSAALAYGLNREMNKRVLVYDLGGGTFDATILRIEKNVFEVLATGGDIFLGGLDFDNAIVDFLLERFQQLENVPFQGDGVALSRVSDAAERAKIALSERQHYEVHIPMLMTDDIGRQRDLNFTMTRADLERICEGLVTRTLDVVRDVLLDARLKPSDIDDIILVGGQARMPLVREKIKALFGKSAHSSVNADEAVALGAALYSTAVDKVSSVVLIDVLPMTIGLAMPGGSFQRVIERNTPLPAQRSFAVSTSRDNEEVLELSIFQGEDNHISANEYLGTVRMEGLPKGPKGAVRVAVTIKMDAECVLFVEAREYQTRKSVRATLATRYTPDQLAQQLNVDASAARAAEERRGADLRERAGRFWSFLKKVVGRS